MKKLIASTLIVATLAGAVSTSYAASGSLALPKLVAGL